MMPFDKVWFWFGRFAIVATLGLNLSCTHSIHLYHVGDSDQAISGSIAARNVKLVSASGEQNTFLGFVSDTKFVEAGIEALKQQCPKGNLEHIQSRFSTSHSFLSWTNKVYYQAYCIL